VELKPREGLHDQKKRCKKKTVEKKTNGPSSGTGQWSCALGGSIRGQNTKKVKVTQERGRRCHGQENRENKGKKGEGGALKNQNLVWSSTSDKNGSVRKKRPSNNLGRKAPVRNGLNTEGGCEETERLFGEGKNSGNHKTRRKGEKKDVSIKRHILKVNTARKKQRKKKLYDRRVLGIGNQKKKVSERKAPAGVPTNRIDILQGAKIKKTGDWIRRGYFAKHKPDRGDKKITWDAPRKRGMELSRECRGGGGYHLPKEGPFWVAWDRNNGASPRKRGMRFPRILPHRRLVCGGESDSATPKFQEKMPGGKKSFEMPLLKRGRRAVSFDVGRTMLKGARGKELKKTESQTKTTNGEGRKEPENRV